MVRGTDFLDGQCRARTCGAAAALTGDREDEEDVEGQLQRIDAIAAELDGARDGLGQANAADLEAGAAKGLDEAARDRPAADLLAEHPALMKRPVIEADGALYLGWDKAVQAKLLG